MSQYNTNRASDSEAEREVARFLDEHLYAGPRFSKAERTDSEESQLKGCDIVLSTSDGALTDIVVDEKAATDYANKPLNTFVLETSFVDRAGEAQLGWFTKPGLETTHYMLCWIPEADIPKGGSLTADSIRRLDYKLVSKDRIKRFLEERGWTTDRIVRQDAKIRRNGGTATDRYIDGVKFHYSDRKAEKPINILLRKDTYGMMADMSGTLTTRQGRTDEQRQ